MMQKIGAVVEKLQFFADTSLAEDYDNVGLLTGDVSQNCTGIMCCLDTTVAVLEEAKNAGCNLVVAHHPILFRGIKSLSGNHYSLRAIRFAIKNDMAIYAIHTNLDNVLNGVNWAMAEKIGLNPDSARILQPKAGNLSKLYTYVPLSHHASVQNALFAAGAGQIGAYHECSFSQIGTGTFRPLPGTNPFIGESGGPRETVEEQKLEVIFESFRLQKILQALFASHPYEEVAYELVQLANINQTVGSGLAGNLAYPVSEQQFLSQLSQQFGSPAVRHSPFTGKTIQKVAICGGTGSFLTPAAISSGADAFVTADLKYHEYFEADGQILLVDIGHYESEQFTIGLLQQYLKRYFTTFAVLSTKVNTNAMNTWVP